MSCRGCSHPTRHLFVCCSSITNSFFFSRFLFRILTAGWCVGTLVPLSPLLCLLRCVPALAGIPSLPCFGSAGRCVPALAGLPSLPVSWVFGSAGRCVPALAGLPSLPVSWVFGSAGLCVPWRRGIWLAVRQVLWCVTSFFFLHLCSLSAHLYRYSDPHQGKPPFAVYCIIKPAGSVSDF
jgi:hypothetical protein